MTDQPLGAEGWDGLIHPGDQHLISGSSLDNVYESYGLTMHQFGNVADFALENLAHLPEWVEQMGRDTVRKMLVTARWPQRPGLSATEQGTIVHAYLHGRLTNQDTTLPPELAEHQAQLQPYFDQVDAFVTERKVCAIDCEAVVYNPVDGVAGRFDAKVTMAGVDGVVLMDLKTAAEEKKIFGSSHPLQLAAYRYAEYQATFEPRVVDGLGGGRVYLLNERELAACVPATPADHTVIVQVYPGGYRVVRVTTNDRVRAYLRSAVNGHRWMNSVGDAMIGEEI